MKIEKTDRVSAKFGGEALTFVIERGSLSSFEQAIDETAQNRLTRIAQGVASIKDIRQVLEFAAPEGRGRSLPLKSSDMLSLQLRRAMEEFRPPKENFVSKTLATNPPLKYAVLAQGILAAALHGIPVEAAHFDEDEEIGGELVDG